MARVSGLVCLVVIAICSIPESISGGIADSIVDGSAAGLSSEKEAEDKDQDTLYKVFSFDLSVTLPGKPVDIFDALTGDISGWWDHSFTSDPHMLYIEPKPGGGFYEIFDEEGNGALHATVIYADRGKLLRFDGPLGLSGKALQLVCSFELSIVGTDSTIVALEVHGAGETTPGLPDLIERVWHHFLLDRFKSYIVEGKHLH